LFFSKPIWLASDSLPHRAAGPLPARAAPSGDADPLRVALFLFGGAVHHDGCQGVCGMDEALVAALARRAGLERALELFPEDIAIAAAQAEGTSAAIQAPASITAEPWPPMRPASGAGVQL
jgi:hypothetical protein